MNPEKRTVLVTSTDNHRTPPAFNNFPPGMSSATFVQPTALPFALADIAFAPLRLTKRGCAVDLKCRGAALVLSIPALKCSAGVTRTASSRSEPSRCELLLTLPQTDNLEMQASTIAINVATAAAVQHLEDHAALVYGERGLGLSGRSLENKLEHDPKACKPLPALRPAKGAQPGQVCLSWPGDAFVNVRGPDGVLIRACDVPIGCYVSGTFLVRLTVSHFHAAIQLEPLQLAVAMSAPRPEAVGVKRPRGAPCGAPQGKAFRYRLDLSGAKSRGRGGVCVAPLTPAREEPTGRAEEMAVSSV